MRRVLSVLVGISVLLAGLSIGYPLSTLAMTSNNSGSNTCTSSYPAPYTGGANVAKFFHLSDGSTVTITTTGAVIKQGRCDTPYREGWINTSDICNIQSAQDLNGRLGSGSSNPFGSANFTGCSTKTQSSSGQTSSSITIVNNNSQSQSQAQSGSGTQASASASSKANNGTSSSAQAQVLGAQTTASTVKTLPNTGPGNILLLSGATSAVGTIGHWYYSRRGRRH